MDKFILLCSEEEKEKIRKLLISKFHRKYRVAKREIINEQNSREVTCEICNKTVTKWNYAKHQKTWKCLQIRKKNESKSEDGMSDEFKSDNENKESEEIK